MNGSSVPNPHGEPGPPLPSPSVRRGAGPDSDAESPPQEARGRGFGSRSAHMPRSRVRSLGRVEGGDGRQPSDVLSHRYFVLFFLPRTLSLSKKKINSPGRCGPVVSAPEGRGCESKGRNLGLLQVCSLLPLGPVQEAAHPGRSLTYIPPPTPSLKIIGKISSREDDKFMFCKKTSVRSHGWECFRTEGTQSMGEKGGGQEGRSLHLE